MVIAGDYEPKSKGKKDREPLVAVQREIKPSVKPNKPTQNPAAATSSCSAFAFEVKREFGKTRAGR